MHDDNKQEESLDIIRIFGQHGVTFKSRSADSSHMIGDCFVCKKPSHLFVNLKDGGWDCKRCGANGGISHFFSHKATENVKRLTGGVAVKLAKKRGLSIKTLREWEVGWDGRQYTIPYNGLGVTTDLRRYRIGSKSKASYGGHLSVVARMTKKSNVVWLCEGEWDAMAMWELLKAANVKESVVGVPGANSFPKKALKLFEGKVVNVAYDNDTAGQKGALAVYNKLKDVCASISFVHWPTNLPDGFDVNDLYIRESSKSRRLLEQMLMSKVPGHSDVVVSTQQAANAVKLPTGESITSVEAIKRYRKWMYMPDSEVLSVMFGAVFANRMDGDPLWLFLVAPPGGSKTEFLMTLTDAPLILTTSSLTPHALISGATSINGGDPSLIPKLDNKVLVVKDFTAVLSMPGPQRDEIFGILRDAYDGQIEWRFGNGIHRQYSSRFGILGGVTPVIESYSATSTMLGERFLKYRIPQLGHIKSGEAIIMAALRNVCRESKMRKQLQQIATDVLNKKVDPENPPELTEKYANRIMRLAQWVSVLRGVISREKYTNVVTVKPTQEVGTRIAKQLARLALGVSIFHDSKKVTEREYQVIVSVARSTVPDRVEEVVKQLFLKAYEDFSKCRDIAKWCGLPDQTVRTILEDLSLLKIVQRDSEDFIGKWRLSRTMLLLMEPLHLYDKEEAWSSMRRQSNKRKVKKVRR